MLILMIKFKRIGGCMYIDLIILIVLIILVVMFFKRFSSFVFFIAIVDIFLRLLTFVKYNIPLKDVSAILGKYFPESLLAIIDSYTISINILNIILRWTYFLLLCIFLGYIIKIFLRKKKI